MTSLDKLVDAARTYQLPLLLALGAVGAAALSRRGGAEKLKNRLVDDYTKVARAVQDVPVQEDGAVPEDWDEYDVIIIGGGTAGCVLASRLSEDPSVRVLLLEAGGSGVVLPFSFIPAAFTKLFHTKHDWNLWTVPQEHMAGKSCYWPRAKLLGGCSSLNAAMFHHCAPEDYDEWVPKGNEEYSSWRYKNFAKYFTKFERFVSDKRFPLVDASLRGTDGPVQIGYFGYFSKIASNFIDSCANVGIPRNADINTSKGTIGVTKVLTYCDAKGRRVTTESAYLTPEVLARPNLTVAVYAQVTRILFEPSASGKPRAAGVEFARSKGAPRFRARARKEVFLTAGAVHSPQVLMVSGVGPAAQLKAHDIPVVVDLPGVGSHLMDHPAAGVVFTDTSGASLNFVNPSGVFHALQLTKAILQYKLAGTGPFTTNAGEAAAFVRSDDPVLFPPAEYPAATTPADETSGPGAPDIELIVLPLGLKDHGQTKLPAGNYMAMLPTLLRPTSKGEITLKSADPFDAPIIDPRYLSTEHDVQVMLRALKLVLRIAQAEPFKSTIDVRGAWQGHGLYAKSDAELVAYLRATAETLYHPACTARMAPRADGGVVDAALRVYGVEGLRVVDASIFPTIVSGHPSAPIIAMAEKIAEEVRQEWGGRGL